MGFLDDVFDDLCPSSLRIPPLQDPFPFPTTTDNRLSPLEPNARTNSNIDNEAAKLTGRGKALAEAKPIGDSEDNELRPIHSTPRKRQKKYEAKHVPDFVQLPKPKAKAKDGKPYPFLPVSVLNQLHEPPPSAALFPPITPNVINVGHDCKHSESSSSQFPKRESLPAEKDEQQEKEVKDSGSPNKRSWVRKRTKWSEKETYCLVRGLDEFGVGKWTKILKHPGYSFSQDRNAVDLKDRFRTLMGSARVEAPEGVSYLELLGYANGIPEPPSQKEGMHKPRKRPKHLWSEEEDESLVKGYQKHGFCWKEIANDPSLALHDRSGPQIRDRFRQRFPDLYSEVPPPSKNPRHAPMESAGGAPVSILKARVANSSAQNGLSKGESDKSKKNDTHSRRPSTTLSKRTLSGSVPQGINSLLNSDEADNHQSSFRSVGGSDNVTLPPLLWEDLCAKPMFELD